MPTSLSFAHRWKIRWIVGETKNHAEGSGLYLGGWSDWILLLVCLKKVHCPRQEQDKAIGGAGGREPASAFSEKQ